MTYPVPELAAPLCAVSAEKARLMDSLEGTNEGRVRFT